MEPQVGLTPKRRKDRYAFALSSFILSIPSFIFLIIPVILIFSGRVTRDSQYIGRMNLLLFLACAASVAGLLFGFMALNSSKGKRLAITGIIISLIPIHFYYYAFNSVIANS
ncbi:hypothetical protein DFP94_103448 [Fontibacillus phaseoli]|uniref:Uncharacterized protein n=1 Tax=Fontibacillus phaseoli TaxID=1416533 RepID=A0A369BHH0_9BACL|nr:hypothetical protein [Fontibacillus phaseoli]RCX20715.1 hypothetical protein DFP94_103448 [Fontibacillus phaseoli]